MLIIKINPNDNIEIVLKRFKTKFKKTKVMEELKDRMFFEKKSDKKRYVKKKAIYIQKLKNKEEN